MTNTESDRAALEARLRQWSIEASIGFAKAFGVAPGGWIQMEAELGTLEACKRILLPEPESRWWVPALGQLWEAKRLDWSVEAVALRPEFASLFSEDERAVARARLREFGYNPATE